MIYLYPANRMEDLVSLLNHVQRISPLPVLAEEVILVQNNGMQHWLNLQMAEKRQISMNLCFSLPASYFWQLIRQLVDQEEGSDQSPYAREVLTWRIYQLMADPAVCDDEVCQEPTRYWRNNGDDHLKRFQLAQQLADLFEQYLIFRPEWVNEWKEGRNHEELHDNSAAKWQGRFWYLLTQAIPYNPQSLVKSAIAKLEQNKHLLPPRLSVFGINTLPPLWMDFLGQISEFTEVHFFHLNPCAEYWGDVMSEKQYVKQLKKWADNQQDPDLTAEIGNPLLANLGQQGREFVSLLQDYITEEFNVFELPNNDDPSTTILKQVQNDILSMSDAREHAEKDALQHDDSIVITSAHSPLREVQGLHDWLLHQFENDKSLTPKDILVMCPQVEAYAPYIDSVFARGWEAYGEGVPPLPCSIADRVSKDSEPMVAAFSEMLTLPDSRFHVSQLLSFLRLPAMQGKFGFSTQDLELISDWIDKASIHWGLDGDHKQQLINTQYSHQQFTWRQGLRRLILGFAHADEATIYDDALLLPWVEGSNAILLGKLMHVCEQLQTYSHELTKARPISEWQTTLFTMLDDLFLQQPDETGFVIISQAIESLAEYAATAELTEAVPLAVITDFLNGHFSQPDPGRQFMIGQVTFCSMLPMRSIPFKVIAILGLNDGEYPRQRQPLDFDLMADAKIKKGDRSRRGDDRYLFLEAMISAREHLYLSYQGRDIRNNNQRQASLVLTELMDYLHRGYGWKFDADAQLRQLTMQPFNQTNYSGDVAGRSFDRNWLALSQQTNERDNLVELAPDDELTQHVDIEDLVRFFDHPSRTFARQRLALYLEDLADDIDDAEPFVSSNLELYKLKDALVYADINSASGRSETELAKARIIKQAELGGKYPDSPQTTTDFARTEEDSSNFYQVLAEHQIGNVDAEAVEIQIEGVAISAILPWRHCDEAGSRQQLINYRCGRFGGKDRMRFWLRHLIASAAGNTDVHSIGFFMGKDKNKDAVVECYQAEPLTDAYEQLSLLIQIWKQGLQQPLLLNADLAIDLHNKGKEIGPDKLKSIWDDYNSFAPIGDDPYVKFFWPICPEQDSIADLHSTVYSSMFEAVEEVTE